MIRIEVRGLLISWATPAAIFPSEASFSERMRFSCVARSSAVRSSTRFSSVRPHWVRLSDAWRSSSVIWLNEPASWPISSPVSISTWWLEVAAGDLVRGLDQDADRAGDVRGDDGDQAEQDEHGQAGQEREGPHDFVADVHVGPLEHPDVEHADDLAVRIANGIVGGDVPVADDEGPAEIALPFGQDGLVHVARHAGPDGPLARVVEDVRRDAQVALEDRRRPDVLVLVLLALEDDVLDPVHDLEVPVEENAAVEDAEEPAVRADDRRRRLEDHPVLLALAGAVGGHGRRDELEEGPLGEVPPFPDEPGLVDDLRSGRDFARQGAADDGIGRLVVARNLRISRPEKDAAGGVGQGQGIEPELRTDVVELAEEVAAADIPDVLDEELAGRRSAERRRGCGSAAPGRPSRPSRGRGGPWSRPVR